MRVNSIIKISCLAAFMLFSVQGYAAETKHTDQTTSQETTTTENGVTAKNPKDDATITSSVKALIKKSKMLAPLTVEVVTNNGVVELTGTVDSESQVTALVELAESIVGVSDVKSSQLSVKSGTQPVADTVTTAKIKGLFIREDLFGNKDLAMMGTSVETKDGVVYIIGTIDNPEQIKNAIDIIQKHVPEVKKVEYSVKKITPTKE